MPSFTCFLVNTATNLFRKSRGQNGVSFNPFVSFSMDTWFAMIFSSMFVACFISIQILTNRKGCGIGIASHLQNYIRNVIDTFFLFTGQPPLTQMERPSAKFCAICWALGATIISGLYSGTILITFVKTSEKPPFYTLSDVAECISTYKCTLAMNTLGGLAHSLLKKDPSFQMALSHNPAVRVSSNLVNSIFAQNTVYYLYFASYIEAQSYIATNRSHHEDEYYFFPYNYVDQWGCPVKKGSPLAQALSEAFDSAQKFGWSRALYQKYLPEVANRINSGKLRSSPAAMTIDGVSGTMVLLAIGCACGVVVFTFEFGLRRFCVRMIAFPADESRKVVPPSTIEAKMHSVNDELASMLCSSDEDWRRLLVVRETLLESLQIVDKKIF